MNRRLSGLDRLTLISNSDAHSPEKLAREANLLEAELSYQGVFGAFKSRNNALLKTLEFFPEEGKYHVDGHRKCKVRLSPEETIRRKGICPVCGKPVTVGVLHRVEKLADKKEAQKPQGAADFEHLIPLKEVIGETMDVGPSSVKVDRLYHRLLALFGNELYILRELPLDHLEAEGLSLLATALRNMRQGRVEIAPGFDGEYGKVALLTPKDRESTGQLSLL